MNRNNEEHFALTPTAEIGRSKFERPFTFSGTFNEGDILPIYVQQYIPGDTVKMRMSSIVRMMTPLVPVMDDCVLDVYFFNVPWRLCWSHYKEFMGENPTAPWVNPTQYEIPQIEAPTGGWDPKSLAVALGEPVGGTGLSTNALKFRAYASIYNNWFRSEAVQTPVYMHEDDTTRTGKNYDPNTYDPVTDTELGAKLLKACKTFDYFTGCLPQPQAGDPVTIPLSDQKLPVSAYELATGNSIREVAFQNAWTQTKNTSGNTGTYVNVISHMAGKSKPSTSTTQFDFVPARGSYSNPKIADSFDATGETYLDNAIPSGSYTLFSDLTSVTGATVTALRQAFAIQKWQERAGMVGQRIGEIIKGHFAVTNPDYRNMIPEYLGGYRSAISMNQVVQTSSTDAVSPQGNTAAYSVTVDRKDDLWTKSFTEWGIIMGLAVVRIKNHTYQQGQNREWAKKKRFDFYWPEFANLSNMGVKVKEIYAKGPSVVDADGNVEDEKIFGYQEAWAEMRYEPDRMYGELRSDYAQSLDIWKYADWYTSRPSLSDDWIKESEDPIGHTLAVQNHDQFFGSFYFGSIWTRPMPVYSIPGLIDHH